MKRVTSLAEAEGSDGGTGGAPQWWHTAHSDGGTGGLHAGADRVQVFNGTFKQWMHKSPEFGEMDRSKTRLCVDGINGTLRSYTKPTGERVAVLDFGALHSGFPCREVSCDSCHGAAHVKPR